MHKRPLLAVPVTLAALAMVLGGVTAAHADDDSTPTITGYVYSTSGTPLPGVDVDIIHPGSWNDANPWPDGSTDAVTNASGEYTISGYPAFAGSLEFYDPNHVYATAYLGGAQFADNATPVDDTTVDTLQVPDMTMQLGGWISSVVTKPDGTTATDLYLMVYAMNPSGDWQLTMQTQITLPTQPGIGGGYWIPWYKYGTVWETPALLPGDYRICVESTWGEPQCEGDTASPGTQHAADGVREHKYRGRFRSQTGGELTGTVVSPTGTPSRTPGFTNGGSTRTRTRGKTSAPFQRATASGTPPTFGPATTSCSFRTVRPSPCTTRTPRRWMPRERSTSSMGNRTRPSPSSKTPCRRRCRPRPP